MMMIIIIIMRRITRRVPAVWMTNRRRHLVKSTFRCLCAPLLLRFGQLWCKYKTCTCLLWQFWKSNPSIATLVRLLSSCKWFVSRAPVHIPGQERQEEEKEGRREAFRQCCNKLGAIANLQIPVVKVRGARGAQPPCFDFVGICPPPARIWAQSAHCWAKAVEVHQKSQCAL